MQEQSCDEIFIKLNTQISNIEQELKFIIEVLKNNTIITDFEAENLCTCEAKEKH